MGKHRYVYEFQNDDKYGFRMEMSPDVQNWQPLMVATYERA
jgi:hypothetical protein